MTRLFPPRGPRLAARAAQAALVGAFTLGALFSPFTGAAHAGEGPTLFNLSVDNDGNGLADDLELAFSSIEAAEDKDAAIADVIARLPFSDETRALQAKAEELSKQLAVADEKDVPALEQQIAEIGAAVEKDPAYVKAVEDLNALYAPQELSSDPTTQARTNWGLARPGDILLQFDYLSPVGYFYSMNYGHAGNLWSSAQVFESLADGVVISDLSTWQSGWKSNLIARDRYRTQSQVVGRMQYRQWLYMGDGRHTPYNFFYWDKWTDARIYCSQLTWKIHKDLGVDLDSNYWPYHFYLGLRYGFWIIPAIAQPAVAPDEIRYSPNIYTVASGTN